MRHLTLNVIHDEHRALWAMLHSMTQLLQQATQQQRTPDFDVLRAMLLYVDEFPERLHHAKESELLFPLLRQRAPELGPVLDRLDREHAQGEKAIRGLEHALLAYEVMGPTRRGAFEQALAQYTAFYLAHMQTEENEVLPSASKVFTPEDWAQLDAAFGSHRDPLTGFEPSDEYKALFSKIVLTAPAPIGLGDAR